MPIVKILAVVLLLGASAFAQSFHVTGIHRASRDNEKTYHTSFDQNIITGTIENRRYTLEQLASWGFYHFEVGKDYPVVKVSDKELKIRVTDKKGRERTEQLNVVSIEETDKEQVEPKPNK